MTANHNDKATLKPVGKLDREPRRPGVAASGLLGSVLARALSVVSQARGTQPCSASRPGLVHALDDHLLLDIGLTVDAVRRDVPRGPWPN